MKITIHLALMSVSLALLSTPTLSAEPAAQPKTDTKWEGWRVVHRDACSTTYESEVTMHKTNKVALTPRRITHVGSGLNYLDAAGKWRESQSRIEMQPDGSATAQRGQHKVKFSPDLRADSAVMLTTKSNRLFQTRPMGLYYFDPIGNRTVRLAEVNEGAVAELLPPNQIIYRGAFDSDAARGDWRLTYTREGFESDVILTHKPSTPEQFGFDPKTVQLQVRHAWSNSAEPRRTKHSIGPQLTDEMLDFGDLQFPTGKAFFSSGHRRTDAPEAAKLSVVAGDDDVLVAKRWESTANGAVLTESVNWGSITDMLDRLPEIPLPGIVAVASSPSPLRLPSATKSAPGVVLDYIAVTSATDYQFGTGTYYINTCVYFSGLVTFYPNAVLKYSQDDNGMLFFFGPNAAVSCLGYSGSPTILTSENEDLFGERLPWSTGTPGYSAERALLFDSSTPGQLVQRLRIRWAQVGLRFFGSVNNVYGTSFECCDRGVYVSSPSHVNFALQSSYCSVNYPASGSGTYSGSFLNHCPGDSENGGIGDGLPDWWEYTYLGTLTYGPADDPNGNCYTLAYEYSNGVTPGYCQPALEATYQVAQLNATATLSCIASAPQCASYSWEHPLGSQISQSAVVTLPSVQYAHAGDYYAYGGAPLLPYPVAWAKKRVILAVVDPTFWGDWQDFIANTAGRSDALWMPFWSNFPNPPVNGTLAWNPNCVLTRYAGYTGISQCNDLNIQIGCKGQVPVTLLTKRHGYTAGHVLSSASSVVGKRVWFCAANGDVETATVRAAAHHNSSTEGDYTLMVFEAELPASILPLKVGSYGPSHAEVFFMTEQGGHVKSCASFPSGPDSGPDAVSKPPFNVVEIMKGGDSGSPNMVAHNGALVFVSGRTSSGPLPIWQTELNELCRTNGFPNYQLDYAW